MRATIPQDVDLEDRLIYGLTPVRFGYLVIAVLLAMVIWRIDSAPWELRAAIDLPILLAAVVLAWGRWRGRPTDELLRDVVLFVRRNYTVTLLARRARRAKVPAVRRGDGLDLAALNRIASSSISPLERAA